MINGYDIAYSLGVVATAPFWMARYATRHKVFLAFGQRMGYVNSRQGDNPAIMIHAVSLGEINATRELVKQLQQARPNLHVVVTTTTVTGFDRGKQLYGNNLNVTLTRFPLDFSTAIHRLLKALRPSLVVLMEGEIWPNFLKQCEQRNIPVILVNGRISEAAFAKYRRIKFIAACMLRRVSAICAQDQVYADRFKALGAPAERLQITGTMKFDTAYIADHIDGDNQLAAELGLGHDPIWVCGSTGPGEEILLLSAYRMLLEKYPTLRLVIVPRKPERFDEVAALIQSVSFKLLRRSSHQPGTNGSVILGDTMGELRKFYSLANVVFVGRSLINLGSRQWGSDMIEPAALAKPVVVGPWTHNFAEAVRSFKFAHAMVEVSTVSSLTQTLANWLSDSSIAIETGKRAQAVVRNNQGATEKHLALVLQYIP